MQARTDKPTTDPRGVPKKGLSAFMSLVLAVGLCPLAPATPAYADIESGLTVPTDNSQPGNATGGDNPAPPVDSQSSSGNEDPDPAPAGDGGGSAQPSAPADLGASGGEAAQPETPTGAIPESSVASVAKDGETAAYHDTLQAAVNAAAEGATVTMLKAVDLGTGYLVVGSDKKITLDLNGNELKSANENNCCTVSVNGKLTVRDSSGNDAGKIVSTAFGGIGTGDNSEVTIASGTIAGQEGAIISGKHKGLSVTVTGGTLEAYDNAVILANGSKGFGGNTFNISGGTFNGKIQSTGYVACGIYAPNDDTWNITGGTFNIDGGAGIVQRGGTVNISGDVVINTIENTTTIKNNTGTNAGKGKVGDSRVVVPCSALVFDGVGGSNYPGLTDASKMTVTGGKFKSDATTSTGAVYVLDSSANKRMEISGGQFSSAPDNGYLASGMGVFDNPDEATRAAYPKVVANGTPVASAVKGGTLAYYSLLQDAISAADEDSVVKLLADATENITVANGKKLALDLNGKTLTNVASGTLKDTIYVELGAELIIDDSATGGTVDNVSHGKAALFNNGTVTINGGKFTRSQEKGSSKTASGQNSYYNILNHGQMTVNGGEVNQSGAYSSLFSNGYYNYNKSTAERTGYVKDTNQAAPKLTITGGKFSGGLNTIKNDDGADLEITGGTFENFKQYVVMNNNVAKISGGTFTASTDATTAVLANYFYTTKATGTETLVNKGFLEVSGGTFTAAGENKNLLATGGDKVESQEGCGIVSVAGGNFNGTIPTGLTSKGQKLEISGGKFSDDSAKNYLMGGKGLAETGGDTYKFKVADVYGVSVAEGIEGGEVTVDVAKAVAGATVTVTAKAGEGCVLDAVSVTDGSGAAVELKDGSFTMPESAVTVSATFNKVIEVPEAKKSLMYTGSEQTGVESATSYVLGGTAKATSAGDYIATVTPAEGYAWADGAKVAKPVKWSIAKAASTVALKGDQTDVYTGGQTAYRLGADKSGSTAGLAFAYYSDEACENGVDPEAVKDAGIYYVRATLAGDPNHEGAVAAPAKLVVSPADLSKAIVGLTDTTLVANGKPQAPEVESVRVGKPDLPAVDYKVIYENAESTEPGTYKITVEPVTSNLINKAEVTYEIVAADPEDEPEPAPKPGEETTPTPKPEPSNPDPSDDPSDGKGEGQEGESGDQGNTGNQSDQDSDSTNGQSGAKDDQSDNTGGQPGNQPAQQPSTPAPAAPAQPAAPAPAPEPAVGAVVENADAGEGVTAEAVVTSEATVTLTSGEAAAGSAVTIDTVTVNGKIYEVTEIAPNAFKGTQAKSVTVGDSVVSIGASAFANSATLTKVVIGGGVTKVAKSAFAGDKKLKSVTIGKSVKTLGKNVFKNCKKLKKVTVKSANLTKASIKNIAKGSSVKTIKLTGKAAKKMAKKYRAWALKGLKVK